MALGAAPEDSLDAFDRASLWLVCPPAGITQPVWDVVCLAALSAMDTGRQRVIMAGLAAQHTLPPVQVLAIGLEVVAGFWGRLQSFVSLGLRPAGWDMVSLAIPSLRAVWGTGWCWCRQPGGWFSPALPVTGLFVWFGWARSRVSSGLGGVSARPGTWCCRFGGVSSDLLSVYPASDGAGRPRFVRRL